MLVGHRITKVEAARKKEGPRQGINFRINIKDAKVKGKKVDITYEYLAEYQKDIGSIKMEGMISAEEEKAVLDEIKKEWADKKRLPQKYTETIVNAINYFGGVNGVLAARIVNLAPPLVPPRFSLSAKKE